MDGSTTGAHPPIGATGEVVRVDDPYYCPGRGWVEIALPEGGKKLCSVPVQSLRAIGAAFETAKVRFTKGGLAYCGPTVEELLNEPFVTLSDEEVELLETTDDGAARGTLPG